MFVFQIVEQGLLVSEMSGGKPSTPVEWSKGQISPVQSKEDVLLLDYESYFNLSHRRQIFSKFPFLQEVDLVCSPHEAMGGYIRFQNPVYEGDIQIIDLEYDALYVYYISFSGGLYQWKDRSVTGKKIQVTQLAKDCLNLSSVQILKFKQFLDEDAGDDKRFGQIIQEALVEFEKGATEYNDILAVFDQPEWAHIKLSDLINFKDQLIKIGGFDSTKPSMMVGWLGTIFNSGIVAVDGLEKVYGVVHVQQNTH